ncbi:10580_t:CDS:2, partial [Scutellospora calospora]
MNKIHDLQECEFGEVSGSVALNFSQVQIILNNLIISCNNSINLLYHIFFCLLIILAIYEREYYKPKINQFKSNRNGGLQFFHYILMNNQQRLQKGQAHIILISHDNTRLCNNIHFYLSKQSKTNDLKFYLQPKLNWSETNVWYKKKYVDKNKLARFMQEIRHITNIDVLVELLSNYSRYKTAVYSSNNNLESQIPFQEITTDLNNIDISR